MILRLLAVTVLALFAATPAAGDNVTRKQQVDSKIATLNDKIAAARVKEQRLAAQIADVSQRIRTLEAEVGDVSRDLATLERDLALQREKLARITELWRLQSEKLDFLRSQHEVAIDRLSDRLVAIYQSGDPTTVDVLLQSSSFSELVSRLDYARELASQDRRIAASVGKAKVRMRVARDRTTVTRRQVVTVTRAVAVRTQQAREVRNELVARENALAGRRAEQREALASVQASKEEYLARGRLAARGQQPARRPDPVVVRIRRRRSSGPRAA